MTWQKDPNALNECMTQTLFDVLFLLQVDF